MGILKRISIHLRFEINAKKVWPVWMLGSIDVSRVLKLVVFGGASKAKLGKKTKVSVGLIREVFARESG